MITVGHIKKPIAGAINIPIDRRTPLGNPFVLKDESERDNVCEQHKDYLQKQIRAKNPAILQALNEIYQAALQGHVNIQCWCAPRRCHGDTIKAVVENAIAKQRAQQ